MRETLSFILNDATVSVEGHSGVVLLDFIRREARLTGTKIGCREGDCGACTVLVGELARERGSGEVVYKNVNSCLLPLGNVAGKHVVTVEGLDLGDGPNAIQAAFVAAGATQCGFCTPGFITSLAGYCLEGGDPMAAISGNVCRCTGYKSIERAVRRVEAEVHAAGVAFPAWFDGIPDRLRELAAARGDGGVNSACAPTHTLVGGGTTLVGGGTDLYVQRFATMTEGALCFAPGVVEQRGIQRDGDRVVLGGAVTVEELARSPVLRPLLPDLAQQMALFGSQPIRNMATLAGNIANASPIGDTMILFLALDAHLTLRRHDRKRVVALREFYRDYKVTGLEDGEVIDSVSFAVLPAGGFCHFEKVSKRKHLDIATVNTAMSCVVNDGTIDVAGCSAGGVAPIPLYLAATSTFLTGRPFDAQTARDALAVAAAEIAPISDVRGSADYKRLLFRQLFFAAFLAHGGEHGSPSIRWEDLT